MNSTEQTSMLALDCHGPRKRGLAVLLSFLLLWSVGCPYFVTFREGSLGPIQGWPPTQESRPLVALDFGRADRRTTSLVSETKRTYADCELFRLVSPGEVPEVLVKVRLSKSLESLSSGNDPLFGLIPIHQSTETYRSITEFRSKDGRLLTITQSERAETWSHLLLIPLFPFMYPESVERRIVRDLARKTILLARQAGAFSGVARMDARRRALRCSSTSRSHANTSAVLLLSSVLLGGCLSAATTEQGPAPSLIQPEELRLTITAGSLFLNGHELKPGVGSKELIALLGRPNRESRGANTVMTWDELGIYVHVGPHDQTLHQIAAAFGPESFHFSPKRLFTGHVSIDEVEVTADTTAEQLGALIDAQEELFIDGHRDRERRLLAVSIGIRSEFDSRSHRKKYVTAPGLHERPQLAPGADPLSQLAGEWDLERFLVAAGRSGASLLTFRTVDVAPPTDRAVSIFAPSEDAGDYAFRLVHGSGTNAYLMTVKSRRGISVDGFPGVYVDGEGWRGTRDQPVGGKTPATTARVKPIEGSDWYGWAIEVLPTTATRPLLVEKPYLKVELTRRKGANK